MGIVFAFTDHPELGWMIVPYTFEYENNRIVLGQRIFELEEAKKSSFLNNAVRKALAYSFELTEQKILQRLTLGKEIPAKTYYQKHFNDAAKKRARQILDEGIKKVVLEAANGPALFFIFDRSKCFHPEDHIEINREQAETVFNFKKTEEGTEYHLSIQSADKNIRLQQHDNIIIGESPCLLISNNRMYHFSDDVDANKLRPFFEKSCIRVARKNEKMYFEKFILKSLKKHPVHIEGFDVIEIKKPAKALLSLENTMKGIGLVLSFHYTDQKIFHSMPQKELIRLNIDGDKYSFTRIKRDFEAEKKLISRLSHKGLHFDISDNSFQLNRNNSADYYIQWLNQTASLFTKPTLKYEINLDEKYYVGQPHISQKISRKTDWFDIHIIIVLDDQTSFPFYKLRNHIIQENPRYKLADGRIFLIPIEWMEKYRDLMLHSRVKKDHFELSEFHFSIIDQLKHEDHVHKLTFEPPDEFLKISPPENLQATLRSYQIDGFRWFEWLRSTGFGGCLADDMGLGKTIQTLACLLNFKNQRPITNKQEPISPKPPQQQLDLFSVVQQEDSAAQTDEPFTSLIIAPASLIHNWLHEIKRFTPTLSTYVYTGSQRIKDLNHLSQFDIVLSTYGTTRNDIDLLQNFLFNYIILDESQNIKNPGSKIYKAVTSLSSKHKLTLTGTPIENSIRDLWAQLNFLNNGILGSQNFFQQNYVIPIEKQRDEIKEQQLQGVIRPFVLRRTKQQVAPELPDLTQEIIHCDMTESQQEIYEREKSKVRNFLMDEFAKHSPKAFSMNVLQGISILRQLSNHPLMVDDAYNGKSGKMKTVMGMLRNIVQEGHKVLMFSTYVKHLRLYEQKLQEEKIDYEILTGQSQNRKKIVEHFKQDEACKVFLISLKAGGVGLNLQEADYVFILDPWWNPASEEQALSRTHRIGQGSKVFVYRFLTKDSIEEKIARLQAKKTKLTHLIQTRKGLEELLDDQK